MTAKERKEYNKELKKWMLLLKSFLAQKKNLSNFFSRQVF